MYNNKEVLTSEETKRLIHLWQYAHDELALEQLVENNMGLVMFFARKYINNGVWFEDLKSAGKEGLIKAINKFDLDKSINAFSSYIGVAIENQIRQEVLKYKKHSDVISLNNPIYNGEEMSIEDKLGTDADQLFNDFILKLKLGIIKDALEALTYREKQIILLRYGLYDVEKKTQVEIGEMLGCSQSTVVRHEQIALMKMRYSKKAMKI